MAEQKSDNPVDTTKKNLFLRKVIITGLAVVIAMVFFAVALLIYNNISVADDEAFAKRIDTAIERADEWVKEHRGQILNKKNMALLQMLSRSNELRPNPVFADIIKRHFAMRCQPACWRRKIAPDYPINERELNQTIDREQLDNKWVLYALAPDMAKVTPEQLNLFDPERWHNRKLTHQLDALIILKRTRKDDEELDRLIEHLSDRISKDLFF